MLVSSGERAIELARDVWDGRVSVAECGARLECNESSAELAVFARRLEAELVKPGCPDSKRHLAWLEAFARAMCTAKCERLAGRIDAAMLAEAEAERAYKRLPEGDRW